MTRLSARAIAAVKVLAEGGRFAEIWSATATPGASKSRSGFPVADGW